MKNSFVFYESFYDVLQMLPDAEDWRTLIEAVCELPSPENMNRFRLQLWRSPSSIFRSRSTPLLHGMRKQSRMGRKVEGRPKRFLYNRTSGSVRF